MEYSPTKKGPEGPTPDNVDQLDCSLTNTVVQLNYFTDGKETTRTYFTEFKRT